MYILKEQSWEDKASLKSELALQSLSKNVTFRWLNNEKKLFLAFMQIWSRIWSYQILSAIWEAEKMLKNLVLPHPQG